jgi:hypothetical protein
MGEVSRRLRRKLATPSTPGGTFGIPKGWRPAKATRGNSRTRIIAVALFVLTRSALAAGQLPHGCLVEINSTDTA